MEDNTNPNTEDNTLKLTTIENMLDRTQKTEIRNHQALESIYRTEENNVFLKI